MIGSQVMAQRAYDNAYSFERERDFRNIGSGVSREAFLGPDGIVYKVGDSLTNLSEVSHVREINRAKDILVDMAYMNLNVPDSKLYRVKGDGRYKDKRVYVVAMQYIDIAPVWYTCESVYGRRLDSGKWEHYPCLCSFDVCPSQVYDYVRTNIGLEDLHYHNVVLDTAGKVWLIDLGD